jgi:protein TonB
MPPVPVAVPEPPKPTVPSQAEINAALNGYNNALWGKIGKYKQYPKIAQMRGWQGEVIVELLLDGNGKLKSKKILTSSGFDVLDKQALDMIDKAAPFPSPPEALRGSSFSITVPIPFKLE